MSDQEIKVTDKRMFTSTGELREEYRFLEDETRAVEKAEAPAGTAASASDAPAVASAPSAPADPSAPLAGARGERAQVEMPPTDPAMGAPGFMDLLQALAEPIPVYLGDAQLPTGETMENLEAARFYIDLLDVLRQKTAGNLDSREATVLEDLLYRLRLRYVQKRD